MKFAYNGHHELIDASFAKKDGTLFYCPKYSEQLVLRKGLIREHHYTHKEDSECNYKGESVAHLKAKNDLYTRLFEDKNAVTFCSKEYRIGKQTCDVYFETRIGSNHTIWNQLKVAIEFQFSKISPSQLSYRTRRYYEADPEISVWWIFLYDKRLDETYISLNSMEIWAHLLYYGNCYYYNYDPEDFGSVYNFGFGLDERFLFDCPLNFSEEEFSAFKIAKCPKIKQKVRKNKSQNNYPIDYIQFSRPALSINDDFHIPECNIVRERRTDRYPRTLEVVRRKKYLQSDFDCE